MKTPRALLLCFTFAFTCGYHPNSFASNDPMSEPQLDAWHESSITQLQDAMSRGELTSVALVEYYLARIAAFDQQGPALNAIAHINPQALAQAQSLDLERAQDGARSPLHGLPVVVKDNYETQEMPTTVGSKLFAGHHPDRDANLVARLKAAGAVILAKTTMHEFAYGITTVGSSFGFTKNPYDLSRNPGGSSGGTGAAVAANFAVFGMGSDTCGSIRIPAAQNNLVGLRPTQGLLSRQGIVPLSSTQDTGGPIARSVMDLAVALDVLQGEDPGDDQTLHLVRPERGVNQYATQLVPQGGAKLGLLNDWLRQEPADEAVAGVVERALEKIGAELDWQIKAVASPQVNESLDRPWNGHAALIYDFKQDIEGYLTQNQELGFSSLRDMVAAGRHHPNIEDSLQASLVIGDQHALYAAELEQRVVVRAALEQLLEDQQFDALVYPTIRQVAALHGEPQNGTNCRLSANSGLPAISVPIGFGPAHMPVGLELLGRAQDEQRLLNLALAIEQLLGRRQPPAATDPATVSEAR